MSYGTKKEKRPKRHSGEERTSFSQLLQSAALGCAIALLCATLMLLLGALLCLRSDDPQALVLPWGLGTLYASALLGGTVAVRRSNGNSLLCGALCGIAFLIFFWIVSIFFQECDSFSLPLSLLLRALVAFFAILGALLGRKRSSRRLHRKR